MPNRIATVLAGALLATAFLALDAPVSSAASATSNPVADSYVQSDKADANFGAATSVKVDGSPVAVSYVKFDVRGLATPPAKVTLRVYTPTSSSTSINVRPVSSTWTESGLTWNDRPEPDATAPTIRSALPISAGTYLEYDVTSLVTDNGLRSFALDTTSSTSKSLPSRESSTNKPELVIETSGTAVPSDSVVVAFAGDVACGTTETYYNGGNGDATHCRMKQTSDLVIKMAPQRVFAMGDLQYNSGRLTDFTISYENSWGRFKEKTHPVVGNHEYGTSGAEGYFTYFGNAATPRQLGCRKSCEGYYSFDISLGTAKWHIAVINGECARINGGVGCAVDSPQHRWLKADLANAGTRCTAVLTHKPRWASNSFYTAEIQPLVDLMYAYRVDLLLAGHAHSYERFAPQTNTARASADGIRQITVGTGGRDSQGFSTASANSLVRKNRIFGVQKLTLHPTSYSWEFVPDPTTPFADAGTANCV